MSGSHGGLNCRCCPCGPAPHSQDRAWSPHTRCERKGQIKPPWVGRRWQVTGHTRCAPYRAWREPCDSEALGRDSRVVAATEQRGQQRARLAHTAPRPGDLEGRRQDQGSEQPRAPLPLGAETKTRV